jgi:hypothetical protein
MKKLIAAAAVVATIGASLGAALPAAAQPWTSGGFRSDRGIEFRIDRGVRNGSLTAQEARTLSRQLDSIHRLERQYARGGVNASEARELDRRYAALEVRLRAEQRDRDGRSYGQGYGRGGFGRR